MNFIVAVDDNWGIGKNGTQTIILPEDRKHFRTLTDGATVIVGHRTLLDFPDGKPLPARNNIIFSRNKSLKIDGATVVTSLDELFAEISDTEPNKVFVIGGESIYKMLLPYCTYAYVTKIMASPESDTFFPDLDKTAGWSLIDSGEVRSYSGIAYAFMTYENMSPIDYK